MDIISSVCVFQKCSFACVVSSLLGDCSRQEGATTAWQLGWE